ncbi:MAG: hypothetical protein M3P49_14490 [Actinomycetota bacterium]|nr:hypothetical protein [Actinomycetota bacterium]
MGQRHAGRRPEKVRDSARVVLEVAQRHGRFIEVIVEGESAERSPCG